jgi:integrase
MKTHNAENERIKRRYFIHLKEALGRGEDLIDHVAKAIDRFETYTKFRNFRAFNIEQVKAFKQHLGEQSAIRSRQPLSQATIYSTLMSLKAFFQWLAGQKDFRSHFSFGDWDYFTPARSTVSIAKACRPPSVPTLEQIRHVLGTMPAMNEIERRDRALISFIILTGARDRAVASFCLCHINIERRLVVQDARIVKTKFRKTFETFFFPVGDDVEKIVVDWVRFLVEEKRWGPDDPLFPRTMVAVGPSGRFEPSGLDRMPWSDAGPIREVFRRAFMGAGLPYFNPHRFRNTLVALGRDQCRTWAEMQAWAQNLGHESLTTTFGSYGKVAPHEQAELVRNAGRGESDKEEKLDRLLAMLEGLRGRPVGPGSELPGSLGGPA